MACDIHAFIEYRHPQSERWDSFGGELNLDRDYRMFGLLADVRCEGAIVQPRGIPKPLGYDAQDKFTLYVTDAESDEKGTASRARAESWVRGGSSVWWDESQHHVTNPDAHTPTWLTTAEYATVLRTYAERADDWERARNAEIEAMQINSPRLYHSVYAAREWPPIKAAVEYGATLAALIAFEEAGYAARLVLWFDN